MGVPLDHRKLAKLLSTDSIEPIPGDDDGVAADELKQKAFDNGATMFASVNVKSRYLERALAITCEGRNGSAHVVGGVSDRKLSHRLSARGSLKETAHKLSTRLSQYTVGRSTNMAALSTVETELFDADTVADLKRLFLPESPRHLSATHVRLARVVRHVFSSDIDDEINNALYREAGPQTAKKLVSMVSSVSAAAKKTGSMVPNAPEYILKARAHLGEMLTIWFLFFWNRLTVCSKRAINNSVVSGFFFTLTVYVLFGPDLVSRYGNKDLDYPFMVANTVVFFFFLLEVILSLLGRGDYILSPLLLDLVALISLLGDTWFFQKGSDDESVQDRLVVARSSRLTRLTRVVRIARVTRLVPHLMKLLSRKNLEFSRAIYEKKLWRVFLFLDTHQVGMISNFDLKCFYMVLLQESCVRSSAKKLLEADVDTLIRMPEREDIISAEFNPRLNFEEFSRVFGETLAGRNVLLTLHERIFNAAGVATLTQRISDRVAMKICIGIVLIAMVMQTLDTRREDQSADQLLVQLAVAAQYEHRQGIESAYRGICKQVASVGDKVKMVFLHLEGWTYLDVKNCSKGISVATMDPFARITQIVDELELRETEVMTACWPDFGDCAKERTTSVALVDTKKQVQYAASTSITQTITLIVFLLIFAYAFNFFIGKFSKRLLQPLQAFVDDMTAMSCLELVQLENSEPPEKTETVNNDVTQMMAWVAKAGADVASKLQGPAKMVDELVHLQKAFAHMKSAVRSWSKYVPPAVVQCLFDAGLEATVGVTKCHVSILFCDIDDFDSQIAHASAEEVMTILSKVLGAIADVIESNSGTLLEFIGDETLACFNAPGHVRLHVHAAAKSALEIHKAIDNLPQMHTLQHVDGMVRLVETTIRCRCGVHTATILAGNIGSHNRMKYGLLGDGINLCARLKGLNTKYNTKTLSTDKVLGNELCRYSFIARPVDRVAVKGRTEPTTVYELLGECCPKDPEMALFELLAKKHAEAFRLYHKQKFAEAKVIFQDVSDSFQEQGIIDEPSMQLVRRCDRYLAEPPPEGWDGVERLKAKLFQVEEPKPEPRADEPTEEPKEEFKEEVAEESAAASPPAPVHALSPPTQEPAPPINEAPALAVTSSDHAVSRVAKGLSVEELAAATATTIEETESPSTKPLVIPGCIE